MAKKEKANGMAILNEQINKKEFSRVYLLGGTEPYLIYQYRDKLVETLIDPNDTMNFIVYKGENTKPEDIIEFADTMPFFTERRVVLVENSNFFKNGCEKLEKALEELPDTTVLVFVEKNIDNRKKLAKQVAQLGTVAMFDAPDSEMLAVWLNGMFAEDQIAISGTTLRYLIDRVGNSMNLLKNEVDKLRAYVVDKKSVSKEDIDLLCVNQVEDKIFDMIDAISDKLYLKGFSSAVITKVMSSFDFYANDELEEELILKEFDKAFKRYGQKYDGRQLYNKIYVYLMRKGFDYQLIKQVLKEGGYENE